MVTKITLNFEEILRYIRKIYALTSAVSIAQRSKPLMLLSLERSIAIEDGYSLIACKFHNLGVGSEVGDVELKGLAALLCAVYIACAA